MAARVAVVTGANQGIGYAIVRRLCKEHPDWAVYGTSRSVANGEEARKKLQDEGFSNMKYVQLDLTDETSMVKLREFLKKEHDGLDVLVNNAGMAFKNAATDSYAVKVKVTFATNVYGTVNVCKHLFPILRDGARVVNLSSLVAPMALHKVEKLAPERYNQYIKNDPPMTIDEITKSMGEFVSAVEDGTFADKGWADDAAYSMSKLADTLISRAQQVEFNKTPERNIVVNAADPGYVSTSMSSYKGPLTIDQGADTPFYLATLPADTEVRGQQVSERKVIDWM